MSQKSILSGAIKRKSQNSQDEPEAKKQSTSPAIIARPSALKCIAVLPGLGDYESSDDSDDSSDFNEEIYGDGNTDLTGRKIKRKKDEEGE